jgi:hypothetical protein
MRRKKSTRLTPPKEKRDLSEIKELLGSLAVGYTDAQLDQLSRELEVGAALLLDMYFEKAGTRRERSAAFDTGEDKR